VIAAAALAAALALPLRAGSNPAPGPTQPGDINNSHAMYVCGPDGLAVAGREDSLLINFYRVPADTKEEILIHVFDPGSGGTVDRGDAWPGSVTRTRFTVYGGKGAYSHPKSQTKRPISRQAGTVLSSHVFGTEHADRWLSFGPFKPEQGELVDGHIYFKLVVHAQSGARCNYFQTACTPWFIECFTFHASLLMDSKPRTVMSFEVEVPAGLTEVYEHNFDADNSGRGYIVTALAREKLRRSFTGSWATNRFLLTAHTEDRRLRYEYVRGQQRKGNTAFFFADREHRPLKIFFGKPVRRISPQ
jgi:hypothetical protein